MKGTLSATLHARAGVKPTRVTCGPRSPHEKKSGSWVGWEANNSLFNKKIKWVKMENPDEEGVTDRFASHAHALLRVESQCRKEGGRGRTREAARTKP